MLCSSAWTACSRRSEIFRPQKIGVKVAAAFTKQRNSLVRETHRETDPKYPMRISGIRFIVEQFFIKIKADAPDLPRAKDIRVDRLTFQKAPQTVR